MQTNKPALNNNTQSTKLLLVTITFLGIFSSLIAQDFYRLPYNNPGLVVDLGVGLWAWPLPMDYDKDGDLDLLVACPDQPYNGIYFFENPGGEKMPVFKPAVRLGDAPRYMHLSYVNDEPRILIPGYEYVDFREQGFDSVRCIYPKPENKQYDIQSEINIHDGHIRANQWYYLDYEADGDHDLIVGVGDWTNYGWDNAYNAQGEWMNDRLHGYVYLLRNMGTDESPVYAPKERIQSSGADVDVYGWPSPTFADFDGDSDLDLICGEFLDSFTYFENIGTRTEPSYTTGRKLKYNSKVIRMDLQMIVPVAIDWDKDGDVDLIVGQEDGRIAFMEHSGKTVNGVPQFLPPRFFQQEADNVKFGASTTPVSIDWDADGDEDILTGNTAGYFGFIENLSTSVTPRWAPPQYLRADGEIIRILAGETKSIQGPCEAKWGETMLSAADWDHDGLPDLLVNSMIGEIEWYKNIGTQKAPRLAAAQHVNVEWPAKPPKPKWNWWDPVGKQLVTQWRTTPVVVDFTGDGLNDLVMLDHEGFLVLYERMKEKDKLKLMPPKRIFVDENNKLIQLNPQKVGSSGRRKIAVVDWDSDGRLDILVDSKNADWWRNCESRNGKIVLKNVGPLGKSILAKHATSPTVVDWNHDGEPDLLLGAEDGHLYYMAHQDAIQYLEEEIKARKPLNAKRKGLQAQPGFISEEFIFTEAPFKQGHASTIEETKAGLIAAWFGGSEEAENDVGIWVSRNKGAGWDDPKEVVNGIQHSQKQYPCWNPVLFQPENGQLMLFYKVGPDETEWWGELLLSYDGGRTWREKQRLPEDILGPIKNKPIQLPDGAILSPSSIEYYKTENGKTREIWLTHLEYSSDLGKTWRKIGPINDGKQFNVIQGSLLTYPNGKMQILCRTEKAGRIYQGWSNDLGETWDKMKPTELPNPDSGTDAVMLKDGRALLVYNHTIDDRRGREFLNVAVSEDGNNWFAAYVLENQIGEYSYPAVIQTADGLVHITYTWKRERIKHVVLDPKLFVLRVIKHGKWPGPKRGEHLK